MTTPLILSRRIACRSSQTGKYLRCVYDKDQAGVRIDASAERVVGSARTRFFVEKFDEAKRLVQIRCGYNYQYWAPQKVVVAGRTCWVIGTANEADEDLSKPSSTVFECIPVSDKSYRFYHPALRKYVGVAVETKTYLQIKEDSSDTFTVIGLPHEKELPKYVVFKGANGLYLHVKSYIKCAYPRIELLKKWKYDPRYAYLRFGKSDKGIPDVLHTTFTNDEGLVRIKAHDNGMFWKYEWDFLRAGSQETNFDNPYTLFKVVAAGDGYTALQSVASERYCSIVSGYGYDNIFNGYKKEDCLNAAKANYIGRLEKIKVEEPVRDRRISDVKYHNKEARIYDIGDIPQNEQAHPNLHDSAGSFQISFTRKRTVDSKWESSISLKTAEEVKSSLGMAIEIPVLGFNLKYQNEHSQTKSTDSTTVESRAESKSGTDGMTQTHTIFVPPMSISIVKFVTKQIHYDIPFSYKESAVLLMNGQQVETVFRDDGLYTATERYTSYSVHNKSLK